MEQLLLHLVGDYITQTNWMANNKTARMFPAFVHAMVYSLPFWLLTGSVNAMTVICASHFIIDHFRLARYLVFIKNWITQPSLRWNDCKDTGYPYTMQSWMAVWLLIIADNTMHLVINYSAIRWL